MERCPEDNEIECEGFLVNLACRILKEQGLCELKKKVGNMERKEAEKLEKELAVIYPQYQVLASPGTGGWSVTIE